MDKLTTPQTHPVSIDQIESNYAEERPKKKRRLLGLFVKLLLVSLLLLCSLAAYRFVTDYMTPPAPEPEPAVNVRIAYAQMSDIHTNSVISGRLEAADEAKVIPKIPGEVTSVRVKMGDPVRKGQLLFELDRSHLRNSLEQTQLSLDAATTNLDRMSMLYAEGAIPLQTLEQAQTAYDSAVQNYNSARTALGDYSVTAPIGGYVTVVNVAAGSIASQAMPAIIISDTNRLEINANISERFINKIYQGDSVNVVIKSYSPDPLSGVVTYVAPAPLPGSVTYPIKITLDNEDDALKPGMFAEIIIESDRADSALTVPSKAVIIKAGRQVVVTLGPGNVVIINEVVTGIDSGEMIEIKEGISMGDRIVVEGQTYLDINSNVTIVE